MSQRNLHPWLDQAWADLGVATTAGPDDQARVRSYYVSVGHPEITSDAVAWCAAFTGACLERAGIPSTRSLLARSYLAYGTAIVSADPGAIAVFSRGPDPALGHVAFVVGETADGLIVLGGNQAHTVSVATIPRTRLLALRWPPAPTTALPNPTADTSSDPPFENALAHVLRMEGGYTNDPYDPGGPTNLGITAADLAAYRSIPNTPENAAQLKAAVAALSAADVAPIYRSLYWEPCQAPSLPPPLALFHFDTAVNHGVVSSARMLQLALGVASDGEIGPLTLAAVAAADLADAVAGYATLRRDRYRALPTFWRFGRGWLARVDATEAAANLLLSTSPIQPPQEPPMPPFPSVPAPSSATASPDAAPKWWGQSLTIWGTIVTTLATVLPIVGPLIGFDVSADMVHQIGDSVIHAGQAIGGVVGILMTIYGRSRAMQPLVRRDFMMKF